MCCTPSYLLCRNTCTLETEFIRGMETFIIIMGHPQSVFNEQINLEWKQIILVFYIDNGIDVVLSQSLKLIKCISFVVFNNYPMTNM